VQIGQVLVVLNSLMVTQLSYKEGVVLGGSEDRVDSNGIVLAKFLRPLQKCASLSIDLVCKKQYYPGIKEEIL
jgi:hypothetical protein